VIVEHFMIIFRHFPGDAEEKCENSQPCTLVTEPW